jgi:hypothetical protein
MTADAKWPAYLGRPENPLDCTIRARAQSILTMDGQVGPLLPIEQALDVVAWHERHLAGQARQRTGWAYAPIHWIRHNTTDQRAVDASALAHAA